MSTALGLFRLQQVDSHIDQIEARLGKIREILENDSEIRAAWSKSKLPKPNNAMSNTQGMTSEEEAQGQTDQNPTGRIQFIWRSVPNPKELLDLQADVVFLKKHLAAIEDQELEAMLRVESTQADLQRFEMILKRVQARLGDENKKLIAEQESLSRDLRPPIGTPGYHQPG